MFNSGVSFVLLFFGPISPHELLFFPTGNAEEAETAGTGDWPRPGLQPDLGRWSASPALSLRACCIAADDEAAAGTFVPAPERATAGLCLVSCWFCLLFLRCRAHT